MKRRLAYYSLTFAKYFGLIWCLFILQNFLNAWLGPYTVWPLLLIYTVFLAMTAPLTTALYWSVALAFTQDLWSGGWFGFSLLLWPLLTWLVAKIIKRWFSHHSFYTMILIGYLAVLTHFGLYRLWQMVFDQTVNTTFTPLTYVALLINIVISLLIMKWLWRLSPGSPVTI